MNRLGVSAVGTTGLCWAQFLQGAKKLVLFKVKRNAQYELSLAVWSLLVKKGYSGNRDWCAALLSRAN